MNTQTTPEKINTPKTGKVLFTGKTHTSHTSPDGAGTARSSDGVLDLKLTQAHPPAEDCFGVAWSACYMGALERAAAQKKVKLPPEITVDAQIDLNLVDGGFLLSARLDVSLPGVDRAVGEQLIQAAHGICPYSKAVHGNIAVETNLI